ncbi:MAG: signal transduction protein, partial [Thermoproteota archaeon]
MRTIRDVMSKPVVTIEEDKTVVEAAKLMGEKRIGSLIVTREGEPVGILTERDILTKAIACDLDICKLKVKEIMSSPLIVVKPDIT